MVQITQEWSAYGNITHEIGPKKFLNMFGFPRIKQTNIRIYLDQGKATNTNNICGFSCFRLGTKGSFQYNRAFNYINCIGFQNIY